MLQAALHAGTAERRSVFELFPRRLPEGRRYGVVAGVGRALDAFEDFRFDDEVLGRARRGPGRRRADAGLAGRLRVHRRHLGVRRGRGLPPLLAAAGGRVDVRRGGAARDAVPLHLQPRLRDRVGGLAHDHGRGRPAVHRDGLAAYARGGGRRGRAGGVRLRASRRPPTSPPGSGTASRRRAPSAHSFTLLHDSEKDAFTAQVESLGRGTTLLVDTYDIAEAVRLGVEIAGPELGAVRLDSGDLGVLAHQVRAQLDDLGATEDPDHRHQRPRRVRHRVARGGARSTATASAPSW